MSGDFDFIALYRELGVDADCSLEEFRRAYRRRVGELHPDRGGGARDVPRLQRLNSLYEAALGFQREHGRLPGAGAAAYADQAAVFASAGRFTPPPAHRSPASAARTGKERTSAPPTRRWHRLAVPLLVVAAVAIWLPRERADDPRAVTSTGYAAPAQEHKDEAPVRLLGVGAREDDVRGVLGDPFVVHGQRWEYGPSWIAFVCGRAVDWYSSPLRPLEGMKAAPSPAESAAARARGCRD